MTTVHTLITALSFFLPLVHEAAIVLTHSKLPLFDGLYRSCLEDSFLEYGKRDAEKGVTFTKFPPVLTIHLKRFDFDF